MKLFTYGTLMRGQRANHLLGEATFVQADSISKVKKLVGLPWPALKEEGADTVPGEVYDVPDSLWTRLDSYEGVPGLYYRKEVTLDSGVVANVYFFTR